jgi:hypothetical protein
MSADGQGMTGDRPNSGRDMVAVVKRSPGIADFPAIVARAVASPIDYQGGERLRMTAGKHDRKTCAPTAPLAMYSGIVQKYLRFPLDFRAAGIMVHPSAGDKASRN